MWPLWPVTPLVFPGLQALDEDGSGAIQRFEWESVLDKATKRLRLSAMQQFKM